MIFQSEKNGFLRPFTILTAGSTYLDIDAYACCVAMAELLRLKGENAIAYSRAVPNYSVPTSLVNQGQIFTFIPEICNLDDAKYIIVDVSDPDFLKDSVPLDKVIAIYDHHVGAEGYWRDRIGENSHIEFIGAAATLIYREWKAAGRQADMSSSTAFLLMAAILDNTLNLTAANTTEEDIKAFGELCKKVGVGDEWREKYFLEVQRNIESDLKNALFTDIKDIRNNEILPSRMAQLCVWDGSGIFEYIPKIKGWFGDTQDWMINIIDLKRHCSFFVCYDCECQKKIEKAFDLCFDDGIAKTALPFLRKEIIKKILLLLEKKR